MTIQLDAYQLLTLIITLLGGFFGIGKMILFGIDKRFTELEKNSKEESKALSNELIRLDRELLNLKADLPMNYERRDDAIRNQSAIMSRLDGLASRLAEYRIIERRNEEVRHAP